MSTMFRQHYLPNGDVFMRGEDNEGFDQSSLNDDLDSQWSEPDVPINYDKQEKQEETSIISRRNWDVFRIFLPKKKQSHSLRFWNRVHVGVRITLCLVLFLLVLATSSLSKVLFLATAYNINGSNRGNTTVPTTEVLVNVSWVWSMIIIVTAPYVFTILRNSLRIIFKKPKPLQIIPFMVVLLFETFHSIGLCLFVFLVAPSLNSMIVLMVSQGIGVVPSIGKFLWRHRSDDYSHRGFATPIWRTISAVSGLVQGAFIGISAWGIYQHTAQPLTICILLPVSLCLISMRWWDNFVQRKISWLRVKDEHSKGSEKMPTSVPESFSDLLRLIDRQRVRIDLYVSVWKVMLTLVLPTVILGSGGSGGSGCLNTFIFKENNGRRCGFIPGYNNITIVFPEHQDCGRYLPFLIAVISVLSSGVGYKMAKAACKIRSQLWCFSLPLVLATPLSYILVLISYSQPVSISYYIGCHMSWYQLPDSQDIFYDLLKDYTQWYYFPIVLAGFISMLFLCAHIWVSTAHRVASTDKLFNRPLYCGVFFDTSLIMNRRTDDSILSSGYRTVRKAGISEQHRSPTFRVEIQKAKIPKVYICVTMWHEDVTEMLQLLKSIFRMDQDQKLRVGAQELLDEQDKDFYEMEAHIMFDNAFGDQTKDEDPYLVNDWVRKFTTTINKAASEVYMSINQLDDPTKCITPYGGQLIWIMPGNNKLTVHLKHKDKIRIKKRWSQVMYMYYLLSYNMVCQEGVDKTILSKMTENTFLLTLDGDVDFQPSAVQMLLDRMKKNRNVGAACGRIHPIGSGPVVWYQKFEYAMSHWLQKAAEHVIGCVLCSPGCFSMFRASALMDDNVLRKYAEVSTEPKHNIQCDQGEDRWLCTLLLQQGHRIEYCAAADAKTYAPGGFKEFYNQRRRWTPSTMANILDVLQSAGRIRRQNRDISLLYIMYQGFLFISSILTPGTIFLLIFSAINTAYPELPLYAAMLLNLVPVVIFIILLFTAKSDVQIAYAGILSLVYALVMMVVLVGVFKQIVESNFCSMTAGFFLFVVGIFILSALLHPQEFVNVIHGFLYFLAIPCMSMLLIFYTFGNLNVVSWGTRESQAVTSTPNTGNLLHGKKKSGVIHDLLNKMKGSDDSDSDYVFSFGNLFRCVCCPRPVLKDYTSNMELLLEKMEDVEYALKHRDDRDDDVSQYETVVGVPENVTPFSQTIFEEGMRSNPLYQQEPQKMFSEIGTDKIPRWTKDKALGDGDTVRLAIDENIFWEELIEEHLKPFALSTKEKQKMAAGLTGLRNKVCTFFFLSNCLFVTLMFILESVSEYTPSLVFHLPCDSGEGGATREPVAIAFTLIFGILLLIQFLCMLMHRFSTLLAIASITEVHFKSETTLEREKERCMEAIEDMYNKSYGAVDYDPSIISGDSGLADNESPGNTLIRRQKTILMNRFIRDATRRKHEKPHSLDAVFRDNLKNVSDNMNTLRECVNEKGEISKDAQKAFPGLSIPSLLNLAELTKREERQTKIHEMAQKRWRKAFFDVQKPKLFDIVGIVRQSTELLDGNQTSPKVRFTDEIEKTSADDSGEKVDARLDGGGAEIWQRVRGKLPSQERGNARYDQSEHSAGNSSSMSSIKTRDAELTVVTVESHVSSSSANLPESSTNKMSSLYGEVPPPVPADGDGPAASVSDFYRAESGLGQHEPGDQLKTQM